MRRMNFPSRDRIIDQRSVLNRFRFIWEVISELRKVTWPTREETKRLTTMVVIISVAMGIMLGLVDEFFSLIANGLFF